MLFRLSAVLALSCLCQAADQPAWLKQLEPVLTRQEAARLFSLQTDNERAQFSEAIWKSKRIASEEYFQRLAYIDGAFGSGKPLSGFHTDRGRVYLSLGAPQKINRLVSSRLFFPIEIWNYAANPEQGLDYAINLMFYQRNGAGDYKLYSPAMDTIRVLMNPQTGNRGMFGINDAITPGDIRTKLTVSPAEEDILEAATGVARGITGSGNEELIGYVTSPAAVLSAGSRPKVNSRISIVRSRPVVRAFETWDSEGVSVIDVVVEASARQRIEIRVLNKGEPVEQAATSFPGGDLRSVEYRHRFSLLPGNYTVIVSIDGAETASTVETHLRQPASELLIGLVESTSKPSPFRFDSLQLSPSKNGATALVQLVKPQTVLWRLTRGTTVVWTAQNRAEDFLPGGLLVREFLESQMPEGDYSLEASGEGWEKRTPIHLGGAQAEAGLVISYNANLSDEFRYNSLGRQSVRRRSLRAAGWYFEKAAAIGGSEETIVNLARFRAIQGDADGARELLHKVLARSPQNFEALAAMGFVEAQLQDYRVAAEYYRKALAVQKSPAIEQALLQIPSN